MKKGLLFILVCLLSCQIFAQANDFGRIVLNTYISDSLNVNADVKNVLSNKLNQITTNYGIGGSQANPRFIITANIVVETKDIIPGPPQMIAQNLAVTMFIGDAYENTIFANVTLSLKGVGTNENKAFIEALKTINPKNKDIEQFVDEGKQKIIEYYVAQCDFIIKDAKTLAQKQKYDEAIYKLALVPEVCQECYFKCLDTLSVIYQQKIDVDCSLKFKQAKLEWAAAQNASGAEKAGDIIATVNPMAGCQVQIDSFIKAVDAKLKADEKERWLFKIKQYNDKLAMQKEQIRMAEEQAKRDDIYRENQSKRESAAAEKQATRNYELDKMKVNAYRDVAVEQARNQPKTITYNRIYWR
jgi:hypothetical protein